MRLQLVASQTCGVDCLFYALFPLQWLARCASRLCLLDVVHSVLFSLKGSSARWSETHCSCCVTLRLLHTNTLLAADVCVLYVHEHIQQYICMLDQMAKHQCLDWLNLNVQLKVRQRVAIDGC
jgi:hypothetical protein